MFSLSPGNLVTNCHNETRAHFCKRTKKIPCYGMKHSFSRHKIGASLKKMVIKEIAYFPTCTVGMMVGVNGVLSSPLIGVRITLFWIILARETVRVFHMFQFSSGF